MHQNKSTYRRQWGIRLLVFGLLAGAVLFRLSDLSARNLWTDEAWVALAALKPTYGEALAAGQSTPPFYLLAVWGLTHLLGGSEVVLRSLSLFFGLGTLLLFWPLARTLTTPAAAVLGLSALVFSPVMVYYSKELKQYSGDAFFAVLILLLTERLREVQGERGACLLLAVAGMVGLGFSHSLVFILPVSLAALWFTLPANQRSKIALIGLSWGAAFAILYLQFFRHQVDSELIDYWSRDFPDFSSTGAFIVWLAGAWRRYLGFFLGFKGPTWGTPLLAIGLLHLFWLRRPQAVLYLAGPLLLAFGASVLQRYPFMAQHNGSRLMLFSAAMVYLTVATGSVAAFHFLWRRQGWRYVALLLAGLILLFLKPLQLVQENLHASLNRSQIKPLVKHLEAKLHPGDQVYVYYYAIHPFKYYYQGDTAQVRWGKSCVETGLQLGGDDDDEEDEEENGPRPPRVWLIAGHYPDNAYMEAFAANLLGPGWRQKDCLTAPGAVLYRFERQATSMAKSPAPLPKSGVSGFPAPQSGKACK
jgi:hypothetical protein